MKSELNIKEVKTAPNFPALYKTASKHSNLTVLFTSEFIGTVVSGPSIFSLGEYTGDWPSCFNKDEWERLPVGSQVIITQE